MTTIRKPGRDKTESAEVVAAASGTVAGDPSSRARRIAFRVAAGVLAALLLAMFAIALAEIVLMWLPEAALEPLAPEGESAADLRPHRVHFNIVGIIAWALVLSLLVQLRRPHRREAPMLMAVGMVLAGTVVYGLSGTLAEWLVEELILLGAVLLVAGLHPRARQMLRRPRLDRAMTGLVALAAVPWVVFAIGQAQLQLQNTAGDAHAEMEHWATAALLAVVVVLGGLIGSTHHAGWRLPAWIAALASIDYGAHSLAFPDVASSAPTLWAAAAIVWGCAFAGAAVRRSRRATPDVEQSALAR